jgi:hypothetical protein
MIRLIKSVHPVNVSSKQNKKEKNTHEGISHHHLPKTSIARTHNTTKDGPSVHASPEKSRPSLARHHGMASLENPPWRHRRTRRGVADAATASHLTTPCPDIRARRCCSFNDHDHHWRTRNDFLDAATTWWGLAVMHAVHGSIANVPL